MKAILALELRGDNTRQLMRLGGWICDQVAPGLGHEVIGSIPLAAWCAEITGRDPKFKYARKFLKYKKDYSQSNSVGSRGVRAIYTLDEGRVYEVKDWKDRYFCMITDWEIRRITEEEVIKWLKEKR